MTTLQEYLDNKYPTQAEKEQVKEVSIASTFIPTFTEHGSWFAKDVYGEIKGGKLNLSKYSNLELIKIENSALKSSLTELILGKKINLKEVDLQCSEFVSLNFSECPSLEKIWLQNCQITSIDFLNTLPNPEKLKELRVSDNKIQSTDIAFFSYFKNLRTLKLGTTRNNLENKKLNQFYGSFKSWKDLGKLEDICIEATDVDSGLEYLPFSLAKSTSQEKEEITEGYAKIECSPYNTNAKCKSIQDELRPFDYDLEAWQLAHPESMLKSRPEYFTNPETKEQWITALENKISKNKETLNYIIQNEFEKAKKIERLKNKIQNLDQTKKEMVDKATQTDFTDKQTEENQELKKKLAKLEIQLAKINLEQQPTLIKNYLALIEDKERKIKEIEQERDRLIDTCGSNTHNINFIWNKKEKELEPLKQELQQLKSEWQSQQLTQQVYYPSKQ